ncbi:MAG TPA: FtsX-like permease family protein [Usitatibacter sp.]|nr:FtsX-like permease family protein [Usitatibacter sp.]
MNRALALMLLRGTLTANRWRLALTLACIALGVALAAAVHTVHSSALAEIDRAARALSGSADLEIRGPRNGFDEETFVRLANRPEVAVASPVVEVEAALAGTRDSIRILGIDALRAMRLQPAFVAGAASSGAPQAATLLDERDAWLSPAASARLRLREGETLRVQTGTGVREYRVAGILPGLQSVGDLAVIDIAAAQAHFNRIGHLSRIDVRLRPGVDGARFATTLDALLPAGVVASTPDSEGQRAAGISRAYRVNLDALALVALATGAFLVVSTLALQAARRRQEFALLRALGITRRGVALLMAIEGAILGAAGSVAGIAIGLWGSDALLRRSGGDLGAGFFSGNAGAFSPDPVALAGIALLAIGASVVAALWVSRSAGRMAIAEALRDRAVDVAPPSRRNVVAALLLFAAGVPLLMLPPMGEIPVGGYGAIALWLAASVAAVGPLCRALLGAFGPRTAALPMLALAQVRHLPGHLAASIAGIVVSASLCVAMAIMVFSFRVSLADWLNGVVGADLYVRTATGGDTGYFTPEEQRRMASIAGLREVQFLRFDRLVMDANGPPLTLIARPVDDRILAGFQAQPPGVPKDGNEIPVWISEAARDLHGWRPGDLIELPIAGRAVRVRVHAIIRDYARTWGAIVMPLADYRRITADAYANDAAIFLEPGMDVARAEQAIRAVLPDSRGVLFEDAADLRQRSLAIFDRSFAVTYALEAIAIVIGLAGVTSSFASLAWSRRREFGVLRFIGLSRREILAMLALEGTAAGALGAALGLVSGAAMSLVLVHVINRQSFHWSVEVHWPVAGLALLIGAIVASCALGARGSGSLAVRKEAVLAVKDDA